MYIINKINKKEKCTKEKEGKRKEEQMERIKYGSKSLKEVQGTQRVSFFPTDIVIAES